jgi:hypothetical protein
MLETQAPESAPRPPAKPPAPRPSVAPSASRTFARFMNDISQLLDEHRYEAAARIATDLPQIAVALADPGLSCSADRIRAWCEQWIRPSAARRDASGSEHETICRSACERIARSEGSQPQWVPARALKRLRLRRHVRNPPRGYLPARTDRLSTEDAAAVQYSEALLEAGRVWYARSAVHDPTVQQNLSRLTVLR